MKSAHGIERARVPLTPRGLEWDRQWMIVNPRGMFLTQRTHPQLARLVPDVRDDALVLEFPGLPPLVVPLSFRGTPANVRVWDDACVGLDEGADAAGWVSRAIGEELRLVRAPPEMRRNANPKFAGLTPAPLGFPDGYPVLVCNEASLEDLNSRLPQPIPMDRFRPNVVLRGLPAWAEDRIDTLTIGPVTLKLVKPCTRCTIPSIDQDTGAPSTDPAPALKQFRFSRELLGVMFGENAVIVSGTGMSLETGAVAQASFEV
ncbi:MAG: MOSC domain-containing protein [Gammaproteobacteria bacterium]|nr:MOSC domain-containing protein [Gammaproteobacteria bacterium]